jgi:hypothetical protein
MAGAVGRTRAVRRGYWGMVIRNAVREFRIVPGSVTSVLLIAAAILAARKLALYEPGKRVPATICAIRDAVRWAAEILNEIDRRWPGK